MSNLSGDQDGWETGGLKMWNQKTIQIFPRFMNLTVALVSEREFVSWPSPENTKQGRVEDLKDLDCVWCKSYDAHSCLGEKSDQITTQGISLGQLSINHIAIS
jgi:hypothetical protein